MTISTMNTKSGTNGILRHRTKRGITLDLQKQKIWFKKQQKEHLFRFDMVSNTHTFEHISYVENSFSDCTIFFLYGLYNAWKLSTSSFPVRIENATTYEQNEC